MQAMTTASPAMVLREILDKLIFDQDNIYMDKTHLIPYCEDKVIDMYFRIVSRTGTLNFDELIANVLMHNNEIIQTAAAYIFDSPEARDCVGEEEYDTLRCDVTKWIRSVERREISAFAPISDYVVKVLEKHKLAFVPFMEERYDDHSKEAFGTHGVVVVNDCQNVLFPGFLQVPSVERLGLGPLNNLVFLRSTLDTTMLLEGAVQP